MVSKKLGDFSLKNLSVEVREGEYFMIIGPSGAGKTILLEMIAGIYRPDTGHIYLDQADITGIEPKDRNIGMVYQDYVLFPHLTVLDNIEFGLIHRKLPHEERKQRVNDCAALLNISHLLHRRPETLSGGEQQRVAMARALVMRPRVLLLDEPLSALDAITRRILQEELKKINRVTGTTFIHITHSFDEIFSLADRVAIMDNGTIVQDGRTEEVFRTPGSEFVAGFVGVENIFRGTGRVEGESSRITVNGVEIVSTSPATGNVSVCIRPEDIRIITPGCDGSMPNMFRGTVKKIDNRGVCHMITVDAGPQFVIALLRHDLEHMGIVENSDIHFTFRPSTVHVFC